MKYLKSSWVSICFFCLFSNIYGGSIYSNPYIKQLNAVSVVVNVKGIGPANLNIEVTLISEREGKMSKSDEYRNMSSEIDLEISGVIVDIVLSEPEILSEKYKDLKNKLDEAIKTKILITKKKYLGEKEAQIDFKISGFYLTSINTGINKNNNNRW